MFIEADLSANEQGMGFRGISECPDCGVRELARGPEHKCASCANRAFRAAVRSNPRAMAVAAATHDRMDGHQPAEVVANAAWEAACDYHRRNG